MIDARTWLLWTVALAVAATATRNPLYLALLLLVGALVERRAPRQGVGLLAPLRFAGLVVLSTSAFNAFTAHIGDTTLVELAGWLPLVGGPATLEALLFGATNGLVLASMYAAVAALNRAVPARELVRLAPRAFRDAGIVVAVALAFIPETTRGLARVREAQAVRGHRFRGLRDWPPLAVPLVVGGLERSTGLAEAMVARGYGSLADRPPARGVQLVTLAGLAAVLAGWLAAAFWAEARVLATATILLGAAALLGGFWLAGRDLRRSSYRVRRWTRADGAVALGALVALVPLLLPLPFVDAGAAAYNPYPRASLPAFDPVAGVALLGLLGPTVFGGRPPRP